MKILLLTTLVNLTMATTAFASTTTNDLKITCSGQAKVVQASGFKYNPAIPPKGRFPGMPASSSMNMEIEFISQSEGCDVLDSKYNYTLKDMMIRTSVTPAQSAKALSEIPVAGQTIEFYISQYYKYKTTKKNLPFFPGLVEEKIHLSTLPIVVAGSQISGGKHLSEINTYKAHGSTPVSMKSDIERLELAEEVLKYSQRGRYNNMLGETLLELEPVSGFLKHDYVKLLWGYLHQLKFNKSTPHGFFDFHVGGIGSRHGAPLTNKVLELQAKQGALSNSETIAFLTEFPAALLASHSNSCAYLPDFMMEDLIGTIHSKLKVLTNSEKYQVRHLVGGSSIGFLVCDYNLEVSDQANEWLTEIKAVVFN